MPQQQRRMRRFGSATGVSVGVSAGALVLVALSAPPAAAATAAKPCPEGTDPASTIDNWKCQLDNIREDLEPKPTPSPTPTRPVVKKPPKKETGSTPKAPARKPKAPSRDGGANGPGGQLPPSAVAPQSAPGGLKPYSPGSAPDLPGVPGLLPAPEVAGSPAAYDGTMPQTRLTTPVAASERQDAPAITLWVAAAAGAAGAVGAVNISVLGRRLRYARGPRR
ncbi:hypothetical protein [Actinomadura sp. 9N407]|uniref:hypothetical protein n=1 Tax=Actinomadura sp. 9N407 TaxID=3375154 RepID=UPI0037B0410B